MILNELQFIKHLSKQSSQGTVTTTEITKKETELGITLPEALCDLYRSFTPEDEVFTIGGSLVPFHELCLTKFTTKFHINTLLVFMKSESRAFGVLIKQEGKRTGQISIYANIDNQRVANYLTNAKTKSERETLNVDESASVSQWIIRRIGYQKIYTCSNIIAFKERMSVAEKAKYWANFDTLYGQATCLYISKTYTDILGLSQVGFTPLADLPHYACIWGSDAVESLDNFIQHNKHEYVWLKKFGKIQLLESDGHDAKNELAQTKNNPFADLQHRSLYSIEPILQYLSRFAHLENESSIEAKLLKKESQLHISFPLPFREYYHYMPKSVYNAYNLHYPVQRLKSDKTGKIKFLAENQEVYYCAIDPQTPYVYYKMSDQRGDWLPWGILDGYLVGEFVWNIACSDELGLDFVQFKNFEPSMLTTGGKLYPYLSDIADGLSAKISEGNFFRVYQIIENEVIALYEKTSQCFYFIANNRASLNDFISSANIKL